MTNIFSPRTLLATKLAHEAGQEILNIGVSNNLGTVSKGTNDVLTIADTASEKIITEGIKKDFGQDGIIAEEGTSTDGATGYTWVIDPLDGTLNYSRHLPIYCVSIGYLHNGQPAGGAIYLPVTDEMFVVEKGVGSFCNDKKLSVNQNTLDKSLATIGFNNRSAAMRPIHNALHGTLMEKAMNVEKIFSTVVALCYVASGRTEIHNELECFLWDVTVGSLLIEEAGGKCSTPDGKPLDFAQVTKQRIVGSNGVVHDEVLDIFQQINYRQKL